jgi:hypothetical protein
VLALRVGRETYVLTESSASELVRRIPRPPLQGGEPVSGTLEAKLRDALHSQEPAVLDRGELALIGTTIEAWATEVGVDAPDVQELREAIADEIA